MNQFIAGDILFSDENDDLVLILGQLGSNLYQVDDGSIFLQDSNVYIMLSNKTYEKIGEL